MQGPNHPQYTHGKRTQEYMKEQSGLIDQLQTLEKIGFELGLLIGSRTRDPKSKMLNEAIQKIYEAATKTCNEVAV